MQVTKCPPGEAKSARLDQWQFGDGSIPPAAIRRARRLAEGDLTACEHAVFEFVVNAGGDVPQEAMEMAQDLLMLTISDFIRESKPLPKARRHRGSKFRPVELAALQAAKVDLYTAFLESGLKKAEFARRIGIPKTHIERLFSLRHHSRLDQIEAAFAALGKRLHVEARNAA